LKQGLIIILGYQAIICFPDFIGKIYSRAGSASGPFTLCKVLSHNKFEKHYIGTQKNLLVDIIKNYFPELTETQYQQFSQLQELYTDWNSKINVISRTDIDHLYERHVLHSLAIARVISFKPYTSILDVGTGGGFPGIPLAIMFPEASFHLVDSIGKKIKVVEGVADALKLKNVKAEQQRVEKLQHKYDFVVSRAVTRLAEFHGWVKGKFNKPHQHDLKNGILYLKGGDLTEELNEAKTKYAVYNITDFFEEEFFDTKKVVYVPMI
jgi:16S rRNA (guanine527-N7)-methyltransferase